MTEELITAFVDGEIQDPSEIENVKSIINLDKDARYEFKVQSFMKKLVAEKCVKYQTPAGLKTRVVSKLKKEDRKLKGNHSALSIFYTKPLLAYGSAAIFILAVMLLIFNRSPKTVNKNDFAIEQTGSENMFVQAKSNFRNIMAGKLLPQFKSDEASQIKNYFQSHGVKYSTVVPNFSGWKLVGAVISEDHGQKFAHHVYANQNGKLIYLFQVDESYLKNNKILKLSNDLVNYLDKGSCYETTNNGTSMLMTKIQNNICAVVSNDNSKDLKQLFCNLN